MKDEFDGSLGVFVTKCVGCYKCSKGTISQEKLPPGARNKTGASCKNCDFLKGETLIVIGLDLAGIIAASSLTSRLEASAD